jgi:hypothetical protein
MINEWKVKCETLQMEKDMIMRDSQSAIHDLTRVKGQLHEAVEQVG